MTELEKWEIEQTEKTKEIWLDALATVDVCTRHLKEVRKNLSFTPKKRILDGPINTLEVSSHMFKNQFTALMELLITKKEAV